MLVYGSSMLDGITIIRAAWEKLSKRLSSIYVFTLIDITSNKK